MAFVSTPDMGQLQPVPVPESIISARGLTMMFGNEAAVQNVSLDVPTGSIFGFIGPSGSGKTTTIRLMTGVLKPSQGEVRVFGTLPTRFGQTQRAKVGYMPQLFVLYPHLTVWENLNFAASLYGMPLFGRRKRLHEVLDFVELAEHRSKLARNISGGMQRRLSLASTLVHSPELIFLDEPTAGIDPVLRRKFWDHFNELKQQNRTLFITTQYVNEASYCDLVGVMAEGKLVVVGTPEELRHKAFGGEIITLKTRQPLTYVHDQQITQMPFVRGGITRNPEGVFRIVVDEASTAMPALVNWAQENDVEVESIEEYLPPFDDVFVELVREDVSYV